MDEGHVRNVTGDRGDARFRWLNIAHNAGIICYRAALLCAGDILLLHLRCAEGVARAFSPQRLLRRCADFACTSHLRAWRHCVRSCGFSTADGVSRDRSESTDRSLSHAVTPAPVQRRWYYNETFKVARTSANAGTAAPRVTA